LNAVAASAAGERRIVGIVLARDEEIWVERAVRSVADFCDELIVCDHRSQDRTPEILKALAAEYGHLSYVRIAQAKASHDLIKPYAGTNTWLLSADADEIYDAARLAAFRLRLLAGEFDEWWGIRLSMLHCASLDFGSRTAIGWPAPPARSGTKLFNFAAISSWDGAAHSRLHGGTPQFREGRTPSVHHVGEHHAWDEVPFRCLHVCFLRRSSREPEREVARQSFGDRRSGPLSRRVWYAARRKAGRPPASWWKLEKYARGELVAVPIDPFFPDGGRGNERARIPALAGA
jgi:hypothetical protein